MRVSGPTFWNFGFALLGLLIGAAALAHPEWHMFGVAMMWLSGTTLALLAFNQVWPAPLDTVLARIGWPAAVSGRTNASAFVPLAQVAQELIDAAPNSPMMQVARQCAGPDLASIIDWYGIWIIGREMPVYGRRPPSNTFERISTEDLLSGVVDGGARVLRWQGADHLTFHDLSVTRRDAKARRAEFSAAVEGGALA